MLRDYLLSIFTVYINSSRIYTIVFIYKSVSNIGLSRVLHTVRSVQLIANQQNL